MLASSCLMASPPRSCDRLDDGNQINTFDKTRVQQKLSCCYNFLYNINNVLVDRLKLNSNMIETFVAFLIIKGKF